jgi:hypothetical protein
MITSFRQAGQMVRPLSRSARVFGVVDDLDVKVVADNGRIQSFSPWLRN